MSKHKKKKPKYIWVIGKKKPQLANKITNLHMT